MTDPRSVQAMEEERRTLERLKVHSPRQEAKAKAASWKSDRFFNPAEAMGELRSKMRANPGSPEQLFKCGRCQDTGWTEVDTAGRGLVERCRRGCDLPRKREKRGQSGPTSAVEIT